MRWILSSCMITSLDQEKYSLFTIFHPGLKASMAWSVSQRTAQSEPPMDTKEMAFCLKYRGFRPGLPCSFSLPSSIISIPVSWPGPMRSVMEWYRPVPPDSKMGSTMRTPSASMSFS